jgi:hypothetical protein
MASSSSSARRAWNDAMKATAGAAALPPGLQQRSQKRRSGRNSNRKQDRRSRARKVNNVMNSGGGDDDDDQFRMAVWADALEGVDLSATAAAAGDDDDEEYDELEDIDDDGKKRKRGGGRRGKQKTVVGLPKRFLPRPLGSILIEEASRVDGVAIEFLAAQATLPQQHQQRPRRKFCPVTGMEGIFSEPKSGIPYANYRALEQIRERPPPWMTLNGSAIFYEAAKSIVEG